MLEFLGLHGSSGHPGSIRSFIHALRPQSEPHCPTGPFPDGDGFTFFRRNADFGIPADELLELARNSLRQGGFIDATAGDEVLPVGFSSGAIFATALLAVAPDRFAGAILLRPQPIADMFLFPDLSAKPVLIISGRHDPRRQPHHAAQLATQLSDAGARVTHHVLDAGHAITSDGSDLSLAAGWLADNFA